MNLPGIDGWQTIRALRAQGLPTLPSRIATERAINPSCAPARLPWQRLQSSVVGCAGSATLKVLALAVGRVWKPV